MYTNIDNYDFIFQLMGGGASTTNSMLVCLLHSRGDTELTQYQYSCHRPRQASGGYILGYPLAHSTHREDTKNGRQDRMWELGGGEENPNTETLGERWSGVR